MTRDEYLRSLDVVTTTWIEVPEGRLFRFTLRDGRLLDRTLSFEAIRRAMSDGGVARMLDDWLKRELEKAYRRCVDHDDCATYRELGQACWQRTYGQAVPSPGTAEEP